MRRALLVLVTTLVALVVVGLAHAESRTKGLIEQLKTNHDYRVRTQAALALGTSGEDVAVPALCGALAADSDVPVRTAAAAALGKLGKQSGLSCLKTAEGKEAAPSVKSQIQKAIATLTSGAGGRATAEPGPDTKYYVAIQVTNKTARPSAEIEPIVVGALRARLAGKKIYAVAPASESPAKGGEIVRARKLKGFLLLATVQPPQYRDGNLTQVIRVTILSYPGKSLHGEIAPKLTQSGSAPNDKDSENLLIKLCAENAADGFAKVAASL